MVTRAQSYISGPVTGSASDAEADDPALLVAALRRGDTDAQAELFDRYSVSVHRLLIRIIGAHDPESSDLLHDTFLRALGHIGRLKEPRALRSWLHGIAVFTAQEWLRARRRMGRPQSDEHTPEWAGVSPQPEARQAVRSFYAVMDAFPEDERVAFVLRFVEGMELTEVAGACGVSMSTARRRIRRAEKRFREIVPSVPALQERLKAGTK